MPSFPSSLSLFPPQAAGETGPMHGPAMDVLADGRKDKDQISGRAGKLPLPAGATEGPATSPVPFDWG